MRPFLLASVLALAAGPAAAVDEELPIEPVRAVLRAEPGRVAVDLTADSVYWIEEVLMVNPLPSGGWPPSLVKRAEDYLNARLRLSSGPGRLVDARWTRALGQIHEEGTLHFRVLYPAPAEGAPLTVAADFYEEYRREALEEGGGKLPERFAGRFATELTVLGRGRLEKRLEPGAAWEIPAADLRRGSAFVLLESLRRGAEAAAGAAAAWPALLALAFALVPRPSGERAGVWAAAALAGAFLPFPAPSWLPWAAGAAAAASAWPKILPPLAFEAASLAVLGRLWAAEASAWLPGAEPAAAARAAAALGAAGAAALLLAALALLLENERRRLSQESESHADVLFARRRALAATVVLIVCGAGLFDAGAPR